MRELRSLPPEHIRGVKNLTPEQLGALIAANLTRVGEEQISAEIDKEDLVVMEKIRKIMDYIEVEEVKRLGLPSNFVKASNTVINIKDMPGKTHRGQYNALEDDIDLNVKTFKNGSLSDKVKTSFHENIHRLAKNFFFYHANTQRLYPRSNGYSVFSEFLGFNEGVVEAYTTFLYRLYFKHIKSVFPDIQEDDNSDKAYVEQVKLFEIIVQVVSRHSNMTNQEVFDMFVRGLFTGHKLWRRMLEKTYGPGTMSFLSSVSQEENDDKQYFLKEKYYERIMFALRSLGNKIDSMDTLNKYFQYIDQVSQVSQYRGFSLALIKNSLINLIERYQEYLQIPDVRGKLGYSDYKILDALEGKAQFFGVKRN